MDVNQKELRLLVILSNQVDDSLSVISIILIKYGQYLMHQSYILKIIISILLYVCMCGSEAMYVQHVSKCLGKSEEDIEIPESVVTVP